MKIFLLILLIAACSADEEYNPYEQQRKQNHNQSAPKSEDSQTQAGTPMEGTQTPAPAPASAPAPAPWKASKREECYRIGCWVDPNNGASVYVYGKFDLNKDNCLNKQEATEYAREKCLSSKRPLSFLTCPANESGQPIRGAWQARCYFKDVTTCDCEVL